MSRTGATLKQGIRFENWARPHHSYYHTFEAFQTTTKLDVANSWLARHPSGAAPFAYEAGIQAQLCDAGRSPRGLSDPEFQSWLAYAYHLDAEKFADLLCSVGMSRGIKSIVDDIINTNVNEDGFISYVETKKHKNLDGDLFIDCTGFNALLIAKVLNAPFHSFSKYLLCDRAIAIGAPYVVEPRRIDPFTRAVALRAGWMWQIPLRARRGIGYVYSSAYLEPKDAEIELRHVTGLHNLPARHLSMRVGYCATPWVKNCVAIGLSAGFVEPLESTGIFLIEHGAKLLAHYFPTAGFNPAVIRHYNRHFERRYLEIRDFLVTHYCVSKRRDTEFWRDVAKPKHIPDTLKDMLAMWEDLPPGRWDLPDVHKIFASLNYQQVLFGMDWIRLPAVRNAREMIVDPSEVVKTIRLRARRALLELPDHVTWLHQWVDHRGISSGLPPEAPPAFGVRLRSKLS
jgi:tryptophan halogenase